MSINKSLKELGIQDYITLGYLYLVVIGVVNIVIYYSSFNINIFDYIAITDILLAPINMLFLNYTFTAMIVIVIAFISYLSKFVVLGINKLIERSAHKRNTPTKSIVFPPILVFILLFSYIFLVLSINMTNGVNSKVKNKTYKLNTTLTFADNTQKDVYVIATTSIYVFYVEKGEDVVTITPISGNVKSIKDIKHN
jgi:hypothetical protein